MLVQLHVRIYSQNVNGKYDLTSDILERNKNTFDIIFIQEPSWRLIRRTVSTTDKEGDPVRGMPTHPEWIPIFHNPKDDADIPRCAAYISSRLKKYRPANRTDIACHRDVQLVTLRTPNREFHFMNVYSDEQRSGINWIHEHSNSIPRLSYMGGDFNCHSPMWDPHSRIADPHAHTLVDTAQELGLILSEPESEAPTYVSHAGTSFSVIDLMFIPSDSRADVHHHILSEERVPSDHCPLVVELYLGEVVDTNPGKSIKRGSEEDISFTAAVAEGIASMPWTPPNSRDSIERVTEDISEVVRSAWEEFSVAKTVSARSKSWWNKLCSAKLATYRRL